MKTIKVLQLFLLLMSLTLKVKAQTTHNNIKTADSLFQLQDWKKAKQAYEFILSDTTYNNLAWNRLGYSNYNLKLYSEAITSYKKSISQKPSTQLKRIVYSRLAKVLAITNDKQGACRVKDHHGPKMRHNHQSDRYRTTKDVRFDVSRP